MTWFPVESLGTLIFLEWLVHGVQSFSMGTHPIFPHLIVLSLTILIGYFRLQGWKKRTITRRNQFLREVATENGELSPGQNTTTDRKDPTQDKTIVGFFHPYCNAGGGGERVLWTAIAYLQRTAPNVVSVVYTGDTDVSKEEIISKAQARFNITLNPKSLFFVFLKNRRFVDASSWPRFTLIGQSLGSVGLALEAMSLVPDVYLDTMGYAFTFPFISLLSYFLFPIPIGAYVHYPTISTDMLERVQSRKAGHTNTGEVASSRWKSTAKLIYYHIFAQMYSACLSRADTIVVNSSWTKNHIDHLLTTGKFNSLVRSPKSPAASSEGVRIVYPPCDVTNLEQFSPENREMIVLSIAQFRPEKEHSKQIAAMHLFLEANPKYRSGEKVVRLVLVGSSRDAGDEARIEELRKQASSLGIQDNVSFIVNAPFQTLATWLRKSSVGISTMVDEHFGINIVEYMAAGLIPLVHASGGPLNDIVVPSESGEPTGYHATTPESYSKALERIFAMSAEEEKDMRLRAKAGAKRFGAQEFEKSWEDGIWKKLI
ncbi:asparagine-linked glycosylation protein [Tulasnella sp. 419]|nr:asparagine-linked glycosylation protein [Tulasnella sp. 419]